MEDKKSLYRLNEKISFRRCSLWEKDESSYGDCTNFNSVEINWNTYYRCNQEGLHYHCTKHPGIELTRKKDGLEGDYFLCSCCGEDNPIEFGDERTLINDCLRMLNIPKFKNAKLIRLDDWYVHEVSEKKKDESGYWINTDVKTDKDGDTIIIVYVGHNDSNEKAQFFIKPEKGQLTSDHKDMDPAKVLSKIEVRFKDRKLSQEYGDSLDID